ncbi:diaminopimelate decarboxylase [Candidatus Woesearchaeota archaeon]|nr:diaminopimelate decarboxylase [Nanoarchaeota archaeon]MCB9370251.1 diaminopimelate decarboxylase [Candidatus Woesearchaeota archaeon]USN44776.1 MAG: diaminopimelate decarboxylase [Candidatus Woesearchaeota archaeon]
MEEMPLVLPESKEKICKSLVQETPCFCYFEEDILKNLEKLKSFEAPFGLTVRYAMKTNSNLALLQLFDSNGFHIDASSVFECYRAMAANIRAEKILLTSQDSPSKEELQDLVEKGVLFNATSLFQLEEFGKCFPKHKISVRFNVGIGSGWTKATSTGGLSSSFGIYAQIDKIQSLLRKYELCLERIHIHIGSGSDPEKQKLVAGKAIELLSIFQDVKIVNLGGGFKVARMKDEKSVDISEISKGSAKLFREFHEKTGRKIHLEIEPGTASIANEGYIISKIKDIVSTGKEGFTFVKLDTGMTENARIPMYGAQHPLYHIPIGHEKENPYPYVVVGPCCESGDILSCERGNSEEIATRTLWEAEIGDLVVVGGAGSYCSSMACANYNSRPRAAEFLVRKTGELVLIRRRQKLEDIYKDDIKI